MSKARQLSNTPNRLTVADDTALALLTGSRDGELVMVRDTGTFYTWSGSSWDIVNQVVPTVNTGASGSLWNDAGTLKLVP